MASLIEDKINHIKLKYVLIPRASNILRELFRKEWLALGNSAWLETDEQGQQFVDGIGKNVFVTTSRRRKKLLQSGRVDLWDFQLLNVVLLKLDLENNANLTPQIKKAIETLADIYSDVRKSSNWINRKEFNLAWENISSILVKFGESSDDLKMLKFARLRSMDIISHPSSISTGMENESTKLDLRNLGNQFYKEQKFIEAVAIYTQSISIQRCKKELALLYSNRSAAYLALQNDILFFKLKMEKAKDNIKNAIELCPTWYKAHYRLGCFYEELNNHKKAAKHFEIALILDPSKIEIRNKLDQVKALMKPDDDNSDVEYTKEEFMKIEMENRILGGSHWTAWKGYCYLKGIQVEKNYKMAAKFFYEGVNDDDEF